MSAILELRTATWASHQRLEKRINFKARIETVGAYRSHLERMWGFHAAIEPRLASPSFRACLSDHESRRKLPLLERDLAALGAAAPAAALLPVCTTIPDCDDPSFTFGCAYVLEGATLGGRSLMPLVQARLGLTPQSGAAYLASYGSAVEDMWREFGEALNRHCATPPQLAIAVDAAVATFSSLEDWLCGLRA